MDSAVCPQIPFLGKSDDDVISEDCLYLNVYTPQLQPKNDRLPVMVWIHGGGYLEGSGGSTHYGPDFLVADGVVIVTLNYRLGALGFLSLGTREIPGNAGLKDQAFALRWVQKEIHQFGGDPGKVTLFGESAGSVSVHLHYLSPVSIGLFQGVIGESGTALSVWAVTDNAIHYGLLLAKAINCSTISIESAQRCLMDADFNTILTSQYLIKPMPEELLIDRFLIFVPSVDRNSSQPFIPDFPINLIEKKEGSHVPFIMGINSDEGLLGTFRRTEEQIANITNNIEELIPFEVRKSSSKSRIQELAQRIRQFYFKDATPSFKNLQGFVDLYTDIIFGYSTAVSAKLYRERATTYLYYFSFNGLFKEAYPKFFEKKYNITGVTHAEEMSYLFVRGEVNQTAPEDSNEMVTWKRMARMWTNFAKVGTPTTGMDPLLQNVTWLPVGNVSTRYLKIDVNLTMEKQNFLDRRVSLWDSIKSSPPSILLASGMAVAASAILYFAK